jgi:hypothetical protein
MDDTFFHIFYLKVDGKAAKKEPRDGTLKEI